MARRSLLVALGLCIAGSTLIGCETTTKPHVTPLPTGVTHTKPGQEMPSPQKKKVSEAPASDPSMLDFTMNRINGAPEPLTEFKGKVVLVVNTASECGLTPQYAGLESLYEKKKDQGLVILGFPANDFHEQEPGSNAQIAAFCTKDYGVTFPMFEKVTVIGPGTCPLYEKLTAASEAPTWNFTKYLLDRNGDLVKRFGPKTTPDDPELVTEIDRLLAAS